MIAKLKTFIRTYTKSLTEPSYYLDVLKADFSFSLKYFLFFFLLVSIISTIDFAINVKPKISEFSRDAIHELTTNYPPDLVIAIKDSTLQVEGTDEPLLVPFPGFMAEPELTSTYDYLLTIDSTEDFPRHNSLFTLAKSDLIIRETDGSKRSVPYSEMNTDLTINKSAISLLTSSAQSVIDRIVAFSPFFYWLAVLIFAPLVAILTLLIYSLILWVGINAGVGDFTYKKSYQLGLHLITFAETAYIAQNLLFPAISFPQLYSIAFFGASVFVMFQLRTTKLKS